MPGRLPGRKNLPRDYLLREESTVYGEIVWSHCTREKNVSTLRIDRCCSDEARARSSTVKTQPNTPVPQHLSTIMYTTRHPWLMWFITASIDTGETRGGVLVMQWLAIPPYNLMGKVYRGSNSISPLTSSLARA
ncbi:hypothetical protein PoB_005767900 [Plakobranchus ocellatus]|uniref:Uncharacterized protein n=1 Tax=Plakobranchus ocellatus TaxID=259542 RepID=A0AAV4CEW0_9GAST|nr:hypothetical protein PoB_005767900 [Plakobranchus ocellatus]